MASDYRVPPETPVLVIGAGPVGMLLALQLAANGTRCTIVERNDDTSEYPKMELSNRRTMEVIAMLSRGLEQLHQDLYGRQSEESLIKRLRRVGRIVLFRLRLSLA